jgi:hypothetical protein
MRNGGGGEEWKRLRRKIFKECRKAFYPTYEEWKVGEEWKMRRGMKTILSLSFQVMLPSF